MGWLPQVPPDQGQSISKGGLSLGVPSHLPSGELLCPNQLPRQDGHQGEQPQQSRSGTSNGHVRPLPLGLHPKMDSYFLKGDFQLPAPDEPGQNLFWRYP
jgi:hypothetical protein